MKYPGILLCILTETGKERQEMYPRKGINKFKMNLLSSCAWTLKLKGYKGALPLYSQETSPCTPVK